MSTTSLGLLDRLKNATPDAPDWRRLYDIYQPLILGWLRRVPALRNETEDLAQQVLVVLLRDLPTFERQRDGAFRAWLRQITVNRIRDHFKALRRQPQAGGALHDMLSHLADAHSGLAGQWDREHDSHVFQKLIEIVRPDFQPKTWQAFVRFGLKGVPASQVAAEMGMSESAVIQAKSRVLKRLREEAGQILD